MDKEKCMVIRRVLWAAAFVIVIVLLFVIGVPLIINECYKQNTGYITVWTGADVLAFYGSVLGAMITAGSLVITIRFTKKQLERDSYLKTETEKWAKLDEVFSEILDEINPIRVINQTIEVGFLDAAKENAFLSKYCISCKLATDRLCSQLNTDDYKKVKELIDSIIQFSEKVTPVIDCEIELYRKMLQLQQRKNVLELLEYSRANAASISPQELEEYNEILKKTEGLTLDQIRMDLREPYEKVNNLYANEYRELLQKKGATFELIRRDIQNKADEVLHLGRKSNANA